MKGIITIAITVVIVLSLLGVVAGASEYDSATTEATYTETVSEGEICGSETVIFEEDDTSMVIDFEMLNEVIESSGSKTEAIINVAALLGVSVTDAEELINAVILFGDEHFEDSDLWTAIRTDIETNPERWVVVAVIILASVTLVTILIRSAIKNTVTQTNTKIKISSIETHAKGVETQVEEVSSELGAVKTEIDDIRAMLVSVLALIKAECASVDALKNNSETSLKITEETALQIFQLINIAMDRKVPSVGSAARKVWYEDAVTKLKEKAGIAGEDGESVE